MSGSLNDAPLVPDSAELFSMIQQLTTAILLLERATTILVSETPSGHVRGIAVEAMQIVRQTMDDLVTKQTGLIGRRHA